MLEDACEQLGYFPYKNQYVKPIDLQKQQQDSYLARVLKKHGVKHAGIHESDEQVRAAIKELFPRIPAYDLDEIVKHAWAKGTDRVGNVQDLALGRRVQLAVIARIRHEYTDYDQLLRAFGWAEARHEVEPVTLRKLIEWRGENEEDDNELEELVRETIVIDDEDGDAANSAIGFPDEDSTDAGNASDTSVEISHRPAAAYDLRVEEANEIETGYARRWQPSRRTDAERTDIARAKLSAARGHPMQTQPRTIVIPNPDRIQHYGEPPRNRHFPQVPFDGRFDHSAGNSASSTPSRPIIIPSDSAERPRPGLQWQQASPYPHVQYLQRAEPIWSDAQHFHSPNLRTWPQHQVAPQQVRSSLAGPPNAREPEERALPSIERVCSPQQARQVSDRTGYVSSGGSAQHSHPTTPDNARPRVRLPGSALRSYGVPAQEVVTEAPRDGRIAQPSYAPSWHRETINLVSPDRRETHRDPPQPQVIRVVTNGGQWYRPVHAEASPHPLPTGFFPRSDMDARQDGGLYDQSSVGYDPAHPQLVDRQHDRHDQQEASRYFEPVIYREPAYPHERSEHQGRVPTMFHGEPFQARQPPIHDTQLPQGQTQPTVIYQVRSEDGRRRLPPAPVHGEPAPVQQMRRPMQYAPYEGQSQQQRTSVYDHPYNDNFNKSTINAPGNPGGSGLPAFQPMYPR